MITVFRLGWDTSALGLDKKRKSRRMRRGATSYELPAAGGDIAF